MKQIIDNDNVQITSSLGEKLPGITFDSELKFKENISKICNIVNKKLNVLHSIANHMSLDKRKMLLKVFIESQFRGAIQTHCATLNVDSKLELWTKYNFLFHMKHLILQYKPCKNQNRCPKTSIYWL